MTDGKVDLVFNTPAGRDRYRADGYQIREATVRHGVPCITTLSGAIAAVARDRGDAQRVPVDVRALQDYHAELEATRDRRDGIARTRVVGTG